MRSWAAGDSGSSRRQVPATPNHVVAGAPMSGPCRALEPRFGRAPARVRDTCTPPSVEARPPCGRLLVPPDAIGLLRNDPPEARKLSRESQKPATTDARKGTIVKRVIELLT